MKPIYLRKRPSLGVIPGWALALHFYRKHWLRRALLALAVGYGIANPTEPKARCPHDHIPTGSKCRPVYTAED